MDEPATHRRLFAGLSGIKLDVESYDLGLGVSLRRTYAHLSSPSLMMFERAEPGKPHPGPWKAAMGGYGYDIEVELSIPVGEPLPANLNPEETVAWITALLRLGNHPHMHVPVLSDVPFSKEEADGKGVFRPYETQPRLLSADKDDVVVTADLVEWVAQTWATGAEMCANNPKFRLALLTVDACLVDGKKAAALLAVWGALEQLFLPGRNELRYRVATHIAAYLEDPGERRLALFKDVLGLYDSRSRAAHSAEDGEMGPLIHSFVIARNALIKMISEGAIPTQRDLERRLFCVAPQ